jgi:glycosyltransferase involved in cell wall biosynthesis
MEFPRGPEISLGGARVSPTMDPMHSIPMAVQPIQALDVQAPQPARVLIATDAWRPQVNGVVRTLETTIAHLRDTGTAVEVIAPERFFSFPAPSYPEIRLSLASVRKIAGIYKAFEPDALHIATEGPIGQMTRHWALRRRFHFTTSYHTKFPEYLHDLLRAPVGWGYAVMRRFHNRSAGMMVATPSLEAELKSRGFTVPINRWSRGVDLSLFQPLPKTDEFPRPVLLYAGRVSKEKSIEDFLAADVPGTKVVVGDGPHRAALEKQFPQARFLGYRRGTALAACYANADCFVFPSRTDTFGLVVIEALACGVPVAAYPVIGPKDIITVPGIGCLHENLATAIRTALASADPAACLAHARTFTWENATRQFRNNLRNHRTGKPFS